MKGDGRVCVPVCEETINRKTSIPKDCKDYYYVSKGYRLVAGDKCEGGLNLSPEKVKCPSNPFVTSDGSGSPIVLIVILALAAIFVLLIGGMIAVSKSKHLRRMLPQRFRDPFASTTFMKLQSFDEDDLAEDSDARELEDQGKEKKKVHNQTFILSIREIPKRYEIQLLPFCTYLHTKRELSHLSRVMRFINTMNKLTRVLGRSSN